MASPDHAATVREAHREAIGLQARFGGYAPLDPSAHDAIVQKRDAATGRLYMALDALVADLERVTRERDEALAGDYGMARAPYGEVEVMRERERAERAERQRDQAMDELRIIRSYAEATINDGHPGIPEMTNVLRRARDVLASIEKEQT